jgi:hypothetical protein
MKTAIAAITLSLISAVSFAKNVDSMSAPTNSSVQFVFQGDGLVPVYANTSSKTRAEVVAELKASQARGDYVHRGDETVHRSTFMSERSVADVRSEAAHVDTVAAARSIDIGA